jgi:hypothetical protein
MKEEPKMIEYILLIAALVFFFWPDPFGLKRKRKPRKPCKHCYGAGFVEHVGEGIKEPCEHCNSYYY